jgi:hypothetical protein
LHQRLPVIRAGAAHERAVDIEQNKRTSQFPVYGPGQFIRGPQSMRRKMIDSESRKIPRRSYPDDVLR